MLVILIIATIYFIWLGFALYKNNRRLYGSLAWLAGIFFLVLTIGGFFRLI